MKNNVRTKLELLENGPSMPRKQSKKRGPYKKKEQEQKSTSKVVEREIESVPIEEQNIVFQPNKGPQTEFLAADEREVLYGGSAGGGKSFAMLADPLRYMGHPSFSGLLLRHTTEELRELIQDLKNIPLILGSSKKTPTKNEIINKALVRKSIVAKKEIKKGEKFSLDNLTAKRPGIGISPMKFKFLINKKSKKNFRKDELIK